MSTISKDQAGAKYPDDLPRLQRQSISARCDRVRELATRSDHDSLLLLWALLDDRAWAVRVEALEELGKRGGPFARTAARALLQDPAPMPRTCAADILGEEGDASDVPRLVQALRDPAWQVRSSAAIALGLLGGDAARQALVAALPGERNPWVRRDLGYALAELPDEAVRACVAQRFAREKDPFAQLGLLWALYRCGESERLAQYLAFLDSPDLLLRRNVINGLGGARIDAHARARIMNTLQQVMETDEHPAVRDDAARLLQELQDQG